MDAPRRKCPWGAGGRETQDAVAEDAGCDPEKSIRDGYTCLSGDTAQRHRSRHQLTPTHKTEMVCAVGRSIASILSNRSR